MNHVGSNYHIGTFDECATLHSDRTFGEVREVDEFPVLPDDFIRKHAVGIVTCDMSGEAEVPAYLVKRGSLHISCPIEDDDDFDAAQVEAISHYLGMLGSILAPVNRIGFRFDILVTCAAGLNRSGVVVARTLMLKPYFGTADQVISLVREARGPLALSNPAMVEWLHSKDTGVLGMPGLLTGLQPGDKLDRV